MNNWFDHLLYYLSPLSQWPKIKNKNYIKLSGVCDHTMAYLIKDLRKGDYRLIFSCDGVSFLKL